MYDILVPDYHQISLFGKVRKEKIEEEMKGDKGKDKMRNEKEKERKDMPKRKNREKIKTKEREYYLLSGFLSLKVIELVLVS